jgi:hypothetical protein
MNGLELYSQKSLIRDRHEETVLTRESIELVS